MCGMSLSSKAGVDIKSYRLTEGIPINKRSHISILIFMKK